MPAATLTLDKIVRLSASLGKSAVSLNKISGSNKGLNNLDNEIVSPL